MKDWPLGVCSNFGGDGNCFANAPMVNARYLLLLTCGSDEPPNAASWKLNTSTPASLPGETYPFSNPVKALAVGVQSCGAHAATPTSSQRCPCKLPGVKSLSLVPASLPLM